MALLDLYDDPNAINTVLIAVHIIFVVGIVAYFSWPKRKRRDETKIL